MTKIPGERRGTIGYADIGDMLRARVARGELRPGDRLVPVRELAGQLRVNVNTVARAYAELARQGVVVTHAGGGTHVAAPAEGALFREAREARLRELVGSAVLQALGLGYRPEQIEAAVLGQLARWQAVEPPAPAREQPVEQTVVFAGSHDLTLDLLAARLRRRDLPVWLTATYGGSLEGLMALARGEAHLAGCHLLDEQTGDYNAPFVTRLLPGRPVALVTLALREQGFLLRPGNPKRIQAPADLARPDVAVAARQRGSGTQVLLEHELRRIGITLEAVRTGDRAYATHLAVAGAVAEGGADVGLGIRGAARAYGLDFIPIATERYELAIPERLLDQPSVQAVLATLVDDDFRRTVHELGGYDVAETGRRRMVN
ncbi:MAG: GntR family transcriptional regulator [Chloroflexi bacterium]|nr:GntR family transcriptional regulator [Chloroflexota bacterium]